MNEKIYNKINDNVFNFNVDPLSCYKITDKVKLNFIRQPIINHKYFLFLVYVTFHYSPLFQPAGQLA